MESAVAVAMILLRRGRLRTAGAVYLFGIWVLASVLILLNGGIFGIALVYYLTLPVTGAWLFGFRAALAIAGFCAGSSLYFPGTPLGTWTMIMAATFLMTVPVAVVSSTPEGQAVAVPIRSGGTSAANRGISKNWCTGERWSC